MICLIWHEYGPTEYDGEGLFKKEDGTYLVFSRTPSVEHENILSPEQAKNYILSAAGSYAAKVLNETHTLKIYHRHRLPVYQLSSLQNFNP